MVKPLYATSLFFRKHSPLLVRSGTFPQFQKIPAFFGIGRVFAPFQCDLRDNEGKPAERPDIQPPQERGYRVALVTCQAEPVTEFMRSDPPLIGRVLLHVRFEQFRDTVIFSHRGTSRDFFQTTL